MGYRTSFYTLAMCESKDFPSSERDELMGLVTQLQGQVAQLTAMVVSPPSRESGGVALGLARRHVVRPCVHQNAPLLE